MTAIRDLARTPDVRPRPATAVRAATFLAAALLTAGTVSACGGGHGSAAGTTAGTGTAAEDTGATRTATAGTGKTRGGGGGGGGTRISVSSGPNGKVIDISASSPANTTEVEGPTTTGKRLPGVLGNARVQDLIQSAGVRSVVVQVSNGEVKIVSGSTSAQVGETVQLVLVSDRAGRIVGDGLGVNTSVTANTPIGVDLVSFTAGTFTVQLTGGSSTTLLNLKVA